MKIPLPCSHEEHTLLLDDEGVFHFPCHPDIEAESALYALSGEEPTGCVLLYRQQLAYPGGENVSALCLAWKLVVEAKMREVLPGLDWYPTVRVYPDSDRSWWEYEYRPTPPTPARSSVSVPLRGVIKAWKRGMVYGHGRLLVGVSPHDTGLVIFKVDHTPFWRSVGRLR